MKEVCFFLLFVSLLLDVRAIDVKGRLIDQSDNPIVGAYLLLQKKDSIIVAQAVSDADGIFRLSTSRAADYVLLVTSVGYAKQTIILNNLQRTIDLGTIELSMESVQLGEVTVQAENIVKVDRQIYFPPSIAIKNSFNSLELLSKLMLPDLLINSSNNTITSLNNQKVQLRINGVEVSPPVGHYGLPLQLLLQVTS